MSDKKVSKVIYGGTTLIDLTADTVQANKLLYGYTAHGADGEEITGSCTYDADTQDANALASENPHEQIRICQRFKSKRIHAEQRRGIRIDLNESR